MRIEYDDPKQIFIMADDYTMAELELYTNNFIRAGYKSFVHHGDHTWLVALKMERIE